MTDLPDNIDLQWIGRTLLAMQREMVELRTEVTDVRHGLTVLTEMTLRLSRDMVHIKELLGRMDARIRRLEDAP